ncbi:YvrJ family protein [Paenibacillus sp. MSJ-34]|uniref:YvrJ family protein n=1 Tax=Paenibacillus sp. MSJ-34 TaxID=2841529 RepID=UPI001C1038C7|nr:YvrJ family protein [Paenibacillus sp. MSJ-34]MBU5442746.1 YvrJ family protein [Paenibacillus sp. MSJ-34]
MENTQFLSYILTAVSQVGFPIVITGYLLFRFEKKLEVLTKSISLLTDVIIKKGEHKKL